MTTPVVIPSPLPAAASGTYAIMRWNLSSLAPTNSAATGDIFEAQIQLYTSTTYRLIMPKLAAPKTAVNVAGVHVLIKKSTDTGPGVEFPLGMAWTSINTSITPAALPSPLPKTSLAASSLWATSPLPVLSASDEISIGFETLSATQTAAAACKNLNGTNGFVTNVLPQMQSTCFNCHAQAGQSAYLAFQMVTNNNAQLCDRASTLSTWPIRPLHPSF